jgi:uncharacterized membrane protein (DUF106 family)
MILSTLLLGIVGAALVVTEVVIVTTEETIVLATDETLVKFSISFFPLILGIVLSIIVAELITLVRLFVVLKIDTTPLKATRTKKGRRNTQESKTVNAEVKNTLGSPNHIVSPLEGRWQCKKDSESEKRLLFSFSNGIV